MKKKIKINRFSETGATANESVLILLMSLIILVVLIRVVLVSTEALYITTILAFIGTLVGLIAWAWKNTVSSFQNRVQLRMLEILSLGEPISKNELFQIIKEENSFHRYTETCSDSLSALVMSGKVVVENELYSLPPIVKSITDEKLRKSKTK